MSDFNTSFITENDKKQVSYAACVGASALTGLAVGRFAGVPGLITVGVAGTVVGLLTCKKLEPVIRQKLLSHASRLSDREIASALGALSGVTGKRRKSELIPLLAEVRSEIVRNPTKYLCQHA